MSYEPALGPVDFSPWLPPTHWHWDAKFKTPEEAIAAGAYAEQKPQALVSASARFIDWLIVGGESGKNARPFDLMWARSAIAQCKAAQVPAFIKQIGTHCVNSANGQTPTRNTFAGFKGGDMRQWPPDLRVREVPKPAAVPSFGAWLRTQKKRRDAIGDLAQDWDTDSERGHGNTADAVRARMKEAGACDAAFSALAAAEREHGKLSLKNT